MCQVCVTGNLREQKSLKPGVMTSVHVNVFLCLLMQSSVPCRKITSNFYKVDKMSPRFKKLPHIRPKSEIRKNGR